MPVEVPDNCDLTFVQVLSRHGSRDPTFSKTSVYAALVEDIKAKVDCFTGKYSFLGNYSYELGSDQLTKFGQRELHDSGVKFYERYKTLARSSIPFIRAGQQDRVAGSALNFSKGFHEARKSDGSADPDDYPYPVLQISEDSNSNNTLHHSLCDNFEDGPNSELASDAQEIWLDIFAPTITMRLNSDLKGMDFSNLDTIHMMDLCPFNTVASEIGELSPFCDLFTELEWQQYDYFQSLGKYYGYGNGRPLGPTQGVGFVNELIARLTSSPVNDQTSTNHTLDSSNRTFPLNLPLYADFSHDKSVL